eukprot:3242414-Karenia_brevis.AAC.1
MPQLMSLLGQGSFDDGSEEVRFQALLQGITQLARHFTAAWRGLQAEVGDDAGMLSTPARGAGHQSSQVQRDLTRQRERARFQRLDVAVRALPEGDMRRAAWTNVDAFSTTW